MAIRCLAGGHRKSLDHVRVPQYGLALGRIDELVTRLVTGLVTGGAFDGLVDDFASDTRCTGWGSAVTVTAPPADQAIDEDDVDYSTTPQTPLNSVIERPAGN